MIHAYYDVGLSVLFVRTPLENLSMPTKSQGAILEKKKKKNK